MLDNQIKALMFSTLQAANAVATGWAPSSVGIVEQQQPTIQGIPTTPTIFYQRLYDSDYGYPQVTDVYDSTHNVFVETTTQVVETHFQISAQCIQDPTNLNLPTPMDMVQWVKMYLSQPSVIASLAAQSIYQLRPRDIPINYFEDDRNNIESIPCIEIVWRHTRAISVNVPIAAHVVPAATPGPVPGTPNPPTMPPTQQGPQIGIYPV